MREVLLQLLTGHDDPFGKALGEKVLAESLPHVITDVIPEPRRHKGIYTCITYYGKLALLKCQVDKHTVPVGSLMHPHLPEEPCRLIQHIAFARCLDMNPYLSGGGMLGLTYGPDNGLLLFAGKECLKLSSF